MLHRCYRVYHVVDLQKMLRSNEDTNWEIDVLRLYVAPTILVLVLWLVMDFGRCQSLGSQKTSEQVEERELAL
ncbi:hypothetical protein SLA2020_191410 [Shorea laevis]